MSRDAASDAKDAAVKTLAEGIANKALGISWYDTESQARRVAEFSGETLYAILKLAVAIRQAKDPQAMVASVKELLDFIGVPV